MLRFRFNFISVYQSFNLFILFLIVVILSVNLACPFLVNKFATMDSLSFLHLGFADWKFLKIFKFALERKWINYVVKMHFFISPQQTSSQSEELMAKYIFTFFKTLIFVETSLIQSVGNVLSPFFFRRGFVFCLHNMVEGKAVGKIHVD